MFWKDEDRLRYLRLLREYAARHDLGVWAYCLMSNHVHLVVVPGRTDSLAATLKPVDMRYSQYVNWTRGLTGHLWQGRPFSCPVDERHLWMAVRYVEQNPLRAGLVEWAEQYPWSSAAAHCGQRKDPLVSGSLETRGVVEDWAAWLRQADDPSVLEALRGRTRSGRPVGDAAFIAALETSAGRPLAARSPGRPKRGN